MKRSKRPFTFLLAAVMLLGLLSGCSSSTETEETDESEVESEQVSETVEEEESEAAPLYSFTVPTMSNVTTYDLTVSGNQSPYIVAYEGLYKFDEDGNIVLGLAESVDVSEDGNTYTYKIRDDACYSDGTKVTAYDFEYSWKRLANPDTGAAYGYLLYTLQVKNAYDVLYGGADIDTLGVTATDESTLVVEFDAALPYMDKILFWPQFAPYPQEFYEQYGDQFGLTVESAPPSAGPMYLTAWENGISYEYSKNEYYYDADNIQTGSVEYQTVTDTATTLMLWESGDADYATLTKETQDSYQDDPALAIEQYTTLSYVLPNLDGSVPALQNLNFRMALALCMDKEDIAENIIGIGAYAGDFFIPEDFAIDENGNSFREKANQYYLETDKDAALEYYNQAKEELGQDTFTLKLNYTDSSQYALIAQYIKSEIENTLPGVTIELAAMPYGTSTSVLRSGEFELVLTTWIADYDDANTFLELFLSDTYYNFGDWSNTEYDALVTASNGADANDEDARFQDQADAEKVLLDDVGVIPVVQGALVVLINDQYKVPSTIKGYLWQYAEQIG